MSASVQPPTLGKYQLRGTLGKGAMGVVHDGWDPVIDRRVAIKTVRLPEGNDPEAQAALARFKREAQAAGRLSHPNIVGVFDYGETDELAYIVMEFVDGFTLKQMLDDGERFPLSEIRRILDGILAALEYSHGRGVVHRDIKPGNIMLTRDGVAKIADFGIARIESSSMTQAGTILGTPAYMSPEQFMGQTVDNRTDIYSTGALLYQLLTGDRPFDGSLTTIMHKVLHAEPPPPPSDLSVTSPPALDAIVARAMARRPEARYATAAAFAQALNHAIPASPGVIEPLDDIASDSTVVWERSQGLGAAGAIAPVPAPPVPATSKPKRSGAATWAIGGIVIAAVAAGGAWFAFRPGAPQSPTTAAPVPAAPQAPPDHALAAASRTHAGNPQTGTNIDANPPANLHAHPCPGPGGPSRAGLFACRDALPRPHPGPDARPSGSGSARSQPRATHGHRRPARAPGCAPGGTRGTPGCGAASGRAHRPRHPPRRRHPRRARCHSPRHRVQPHPRRCRRERHRHPHWLRRRQWPRGCAAPGLRRAAAPAATDWRVSSFTPAYCQALDLLRPIARTTGPAAARVQIRLADGQAVLHDNAVIAANVTFPNFAGHLQVDYLQNDGTVAHLVPNQAYPDRTFTAGARTELGRPRPGFPGWQVGAPFGTDMIVAIVSTAPLFARPRPESEPTEAYLRDLQAAMDDIRRRGGTLTADAVLLETSK